MKITWFASFWASDHLGLVQTVVFDPSDRFFNLCSSTIGLLCKRETNAVHDLEVINYQLCNRSLHPAAWLLAACSDLLIVAIFHTCVVIAFAGIVGLLICLQWTTRSSSFATDGWVAVSCRSLRYFNAFASWQRLQFLSIFIFLPPPSLHPPSSHSSISLLQSPPSAISPSPCTVSPSLSVLLLYLSLTICLSPSSVSPSVPHSPTSIPLAHPVPVLSFIPSNAAISSLNLIPAR